jgi:hypothetical protein
MESEIKPTSSEKENLLFFSETNTSSKGGSGLEINKGSIPLTSITSSIPPVTSDNSNREVEERTELSAERRFSNYKDSGYTPMPVGSIHHFERYEGGDSFLPVHLYEKLAKAMERAFEAELVVGQSDKKVLKCMKKLEENFRGWLTAIKKSQEL